MIAALSVLAIATVGGSGLGAAVVCIGADGHAGIESLSDSCCLPAESRSGAVPAVSDDRCGECVDVLLEALPGSARLLVDARAVPVIFERPAEDSSVRRESSIGPFSAGPSSDLALLSTVVLLT